MASRASLEGELEQLLGRSLPKRLTFEKSIRAEVSDLWQPAIDLVRHELDNPQGLLTRPVVARHLEGLVLDGLLLTQPHNYQGLLHRPAAPGRAGAIARAAELMEELPKEPWTVVRLAHEVHLSVRALQYGFKRDLHMPPMAYLMRVRLRRAHAVLLASSPEITTVGAIALECGFLHMSRFAAAYRQAFDETEDARSPAVGHMTTEPHTHAAIRSRLFAWSGASRRVLRTWPPSLSDSSTSSVGAAWDGTRLDR